ncbi:MAG: VOC family protein [Micropruina sp.]|nr:VOC family protein [Micropruina sp.]
MQKIVPSIWFDHNAAEAVAFYTEHFPDSRVLHEQHYPESGLPDFQREFAGQVVAIDFELRGFRFTAINAGPQFPVTPAISFTLPFDESANPDARAEMQALWNVLAEGGQVMMQLTEYPFSPYYGWVTDRYGVGWQFILTDPQTGPRPSVLTSLLFGVQAQNRAEEALDFYSSLFPEGRIVMVARYPQATGPASEGAVMYSELQAFGQWLTLMDSGAEQLDTFSPGVSLMLLCEDQAEIDRYWTALSTVPEAEQCGWCVDRFGVSWQVVPANLDEYLHTPENYQAMLQMKKIDLSRFG